MSFTTIDEFTLHNEMTKANTCCFTGHRAQKLVWGKEESDPRCLKMKEDLKNEIVNAINNGYVNFLCGMAQGFDLVCAETILKLKKEYPNIKLICALPCKTQAENWTFIDKQRHKKAVREADAVRCLYDTYVGAYCMIERNYYMVDNSSLVIALFNGTPGGTKTTLDYATSKGAKVIILKEE